MYQALPCTRSITPYLYVPLCMYQQSYITYIPVQQTTSTSYIVLVLISRASSTSTSYDVHRISQLYYVHRTWQTTCARTQYLVRCTLYKGTQYSYEVLCTMYEVLCTSYKGTRYKVELLPWYSTPEVYRVDIVLLALAQLQCVHVRTCAHTRANVYALYNRNIIDTRQLLLPSMSRALYIVLSADTDK